MIDVDRNRSGITMGRLRLQEPEDSGPPSRRIDVNRRIWISLMMLLVVSTSCRSDEEQARDAVLNFVEALEVHNAPFRAYGFLTSDDKDAVTSDEFARLHSVEGTSPETVVTIKSTSMMPQHGNFLVEIARPDAEIEERVYIAVADKQDQRWRVDMDFARRMVLLEVAREAREYAESGDIEAARELLESETERPFRASRPGQVQSKIDAVWAIVEDQERSAEITEKLAGATELELEELEEAIDEISVLVKPEEDTFQAKLKELRARHAKQLKEARLKSFEIDSQKVRRVRRSGDLVREAVLQVSHGLELPVSTLVLTVEFIERDGEDPIGRESYVVIRDGVFEAEEAQEFVVRLDEPEGWSGKKIRVFAVDFEFVGGEAP